MKPKLRFKEFSDDWEEKKLGEIGYFIKGKGLSKKDIVDDGEYPCILYGELYTKYREVINRVYSKTNHCSNVEVSSGNEVLIPSSGESNEEIAQASYLPYKNILLGGDINIFRSLENGIYISYFLNQNAKRLSVIAQGATVVHLYASALEKVKITLPSLPEQEKIGAFLSQLDDRIEKQEQKIALLKERKKGWMQQLFSQTIRFKDENGQDYPAWEEKKLGEIAEIKAGKDLDKNKLIDNGFPVFGNALNNKGLLGFYSDYEFINDAVTVTGRGDIGKAFYRKGKFNTVGRLISVCSNQNSHFLAEAINRIKIFNESTGVPQLTALQLKEYKVLLPSLPEQEKIAEFLSKQDELIEKEEEKLSLLKEQKKGFLQQMLI